MCRLLKTCAACRRMEASSENVYRINVPYVLRERELGKVRTGRHNCCRILRQADLSSVEYRCSLAQDKLSVWPGLTGNRSPSGASALSLKCKPFRSAKPTGLILTILNTTSWLWDLRVTISPIIIGLIPFRRKRSLPAIIYESFTPFGDHVEW